MQKLLALFLVFCAGCATLKPGKDGSTLVEYQGTASGAAQILAEQNRRLQTEQAGDVAKAAIEKKMPTTLGQDAVRSDVQAGWMMGLYAPNGMYAPGFNPNNMTAAQVEMMGQMPGYLPRLGEPIVYVQPGQPQVVQTAGGLTACPSGRSPSTVAEVTACNALDVKHLIKDFYRK